MSDDVANGVFGPGTQQGIRNNPLAEGSSGTWVSLFTASMIFTWSMPAKRTPRASACSGRFVIGSLPGTVSAASVAREPL